MLTSLLRTVGFDVQEAENGESAILLWQEWRPQLTLMDMRMPGMEELDHATHSPYRAGGRRDSGTDGVRDGGEPAGGEWRAE